MTRSKRKPIQNEIVRKLSIMSTGSTKELRDAWDNIIRKDREQLQSWIGDEKMPRFVRREQGKWRADRNREDRKLKRELKQEGRLK